MNISILTLFYKQYVYFILLIIFIISLFQLGSWGITESSEARYAQIAKEMFDSGNYIHPTKMGIYHYHKPPLTYYITALGYYLFGENEFGVRFFLSVALLIQLILVYKTSLLVFNDRETSFLALVLYFSTPLVLASVRTLTTDAYLNTFIIMSFYFWLRYLKDKKFFFLFYLSLSLGFLTKGPLVFIPIFIFQVMWYFYNTIRVKLSVYDLLGILLFFISCSWWYLIVIKENPLILDYFMNNQIYNRMFSQTAFSRGKPFWYYFVFIPITLFPWFVYIFFALKKRIETNENSLKNRALIVSFCLIILIFSIFKTKLIFYVLPSLFLLILYCSNLLKNISENLWKKFTFFLNGYFLLLFIVVLISLLLDKIKIPLLSLTILVSGLVISIFFFST